MFINVTYFYENELILRIYLQRYIKFEAILRCCAASRKHIWFFCRMSKFIFSHFEIIILFSKSIKITSTKILFGSSYINITSEEQETTMLKRRFRRLARPHWYVHTQHQMPYSSLATPSGGSCRKMVNVWTSNHVVMHAMGNCYTLIYAYTSACPASFDINISSSFHPFI